MVIEHCCVSLGGTWHSGFYCAGEGFTSQIDLFNKYGDALYLQIFVTNRKTLYYRLNWKLITDLKCRKIIFVTLDISRSCPDFRISFRRDLCKATHELHWRTVSYEILCLQLVSFAQEYPRCVSLIFQFVLKGNELVGLRLHELRSRSALNWSTKDIDIYFCTLLGMWRWWVELFRLPSENLDLKCRKIIFVTLDISRSCPDFRISFRRDLCKATHELHWRTVSYEILCLQLVSFVQEYPRCVSLIFQFVLKGNELVGLRLHELRSRSALNWSTKDIDIYFCTLLGMWRWWVELFRLPSENLDLKCRKIIFVTLDISRSCPDFRISFRRDLCKATHELHWRTVSYEILCLQLVSFVQEYPRCVSLIFQFVLKGNELVGLRLHELRSRSALNWSTKDIDIYFCTLLGMWRWWVELFRLPSEIITFLE